MSLGAAQAAAAGAAAVAARTRNALQEAAVRAGQLAQLAVAAAVRASESALRAEALAADELLLAHGPAGRAVSQSLVASELERLVGASPALRFAEDDEGERHATCCVWCSLQLQGTAEEQLKKARDHLGSKLHKERATYGGRTLLSFFGKPVAGPAPPPHAPPDASTLCAGFYKPTVALASSGLVHACDVRWLLEREPMRPACWQPDRYWKSKLLTTAGDGSPPTEVAVEGTLRSARCTRFSVDADGRALADGMCDACRKLPREHAFREMVRKHALALANGERDQRRVRFDLLSAERRLELLRALVAQNRELKRRMWLLQQNYLRKAARVRSLLGRLKETAVRGDTKALVDDIVRIEAAGKWAQRATLFNFLKDLVGSLAKREDARGVHSRGMRWHASTKRVFATLLVQGGPKVLRFMHETLETPALSTVRKALRETKLHYKPGVSEELGAAIGEIYAKAKAAKGITEPIPYELQEDETTVPGASKYNQRLDSIVGTCGHKGPNHTCCDDGGSRVIGSGDDAYKIIEEHFETQQLAGYLRLMVVVPQVHGLPRLVVLVHATCNRAQPGPRTATPPRPAPSYRR